MRRYRAVATDAAMQRVMGMPSLYVEALLQRMARSGLSMREEVGRVAVAADRLQDVTLTEEDPR